MCDYSLNAYPNRLAKVGDRLTAAHFEGSPCRGFADANDPTMAVCLLPGTEIAFATPIRWQAGLFRIKDRVSAYKVARFRQINPDDPYTQHDALELPDGEIVFLNHLALGQGATVLQLPAGAVAVAGVHVYI